MGRTAGGHGTARSSIFLEEDGISSSGIREEQRTRVMVLLNKGAQPLASSGASQPLSRFRRNLRFTLPEAHAPT